MADVRFGKMSKRAGLRRILLVTLLAALGIFAALALYLSITVKPGKYRPMIERALSEKAGRNVTMGKMGFSFWGGIAFEVREFTVAGNAIHPDESPLKFESGRFKMKILPLLFGEVRVSEVVVDSPVLYLRKYRDGHLSIEDMLVNLGSGKKRAKGKSTIGKDPLDLEIETVRVTGGSFTFVAELPDQRVERATVKPVNVRLDHIGFDRKVKTAISFDIHEPRIGAIDLAGSVLVSSTGKEAGDVSFTLSGKVLDVPAAVEGGVTLAGEVPEFEGIVTGENLEIKNIAKIYTALTKEELPIRSGGKGHFFLAAGGNPDEFGFEGELDLTDATLFFQDKVEKYAGSELNLIFQGRYIKPIVLISNAEFKLPHLLSSITGTYSIARGTFEVQSSFEVERLESVTQFFKGISQLNLSGGFTTSASLTGKHRTLQNLSVQTYLSGVNLDILEKKGNVRNLEGHIELTRDSVHLNPLTGLLNGQRVFLSGKLVRKDILRGEFTAKASYLDVDAILGGMTKNGENGTGKKGEEKQRFPDLVKKADVSANVSVDTLKYRNVEMSNVAGIFRLKDGRAEWENFEVGLFDGKVQTTGSAGLFTEDLPFQVRLDSKGVSLFDFFKGLTSYGGFMDGVVDVTFSMAGDARSSANIRKTVSGKGVIDIESGKIEGVDLLSDIGGAAGIREAISSYTGKARLNRSVTLFDDLSAPFEIRAGEAIAKDFLFSTSSFRLKGEARLTGDNRFVFSGDALIPKEIVGAAGGIEKFVTDEGGNLVVPVKIAGPINRPRVTLDPKGLLEKKKEETIQREKKRLEKKILDTLKDKKIF